MEFLSTNEIAELWGVSRKTVSRYAREGRITGANLVGNTWMIPADAKKPDAACSEEAAASEFHFPLYIYRDFFNLKSSLKTREEKKLYSACEAVLDGKYKDCYELCSEINLSTENIHVQITCLYLMARCSLYLNQYSVFMRHALEMNVLFHEDFDHKEEERFLLFDLEGYYKGSDSVIRNSFSSEYDYNEEFIPIITTMSLYRQILLSFQDKRDIDTIPYELTAKTFDNNGFIYPSILLHAELAMIYYNKKKYDSSYMHAKNAYETALKYNGFAIFTELYSVAPKIVDKALKHYSIAIDPKLKEISKHFKRSYIGLMIYLKKPKSAFTLINNDYDYIIYAINGMTNKEIAAAESISENSVSQRYAKLYRSFSVNTKKDLVNAFIEELRQY